MATSGIQVNQFDYSKIFIGGNRYKTATYTNGTGSTVNLVAGTIMGRITSSNKVTPQVSSATNGSQVPMGILAAPYTVANGASVTVTYCVAGDVAREQITLGGSDTFATAITVNDSAGTPNTVPMGTIEDILIRSGIITVVTTENTFADNA
jgi:hypothetical protein